MGFAIEGSAVRRVGAELAASPYGMELQFHVLSGGRLGRTVGISAQFPFAIANVARPHWEAGGGAARLMRYAEELGVADARWRLIQDALFTVVVRDGGIPRGMYYVPVFVKFRVREGAPLGAKV